MLKDNDAMLKKHHFSLSVFECGCIEKCTQFPTNITTDLREISLLWERTSEDADIKLCR